MRNTILTFFSAFLLATSYSAAADNESDLVKVLEAAMASDIRTDKERDRDRNRKPVKTLEFFGIEQNMTVLELIPGGGWYTKLLGPLLRDKGELHVAIGTSRVEEKVLSLNGMDQVKVLDAKAEISMSTTPRLRTVASLDLGKRKFDAVLTFRNVHNFDAAGRAALNNAAFAALKPGGVYGVVDHTRRHMEPFGLENRRRADPVLIIKEVQAAGFEFEDYSDLHYRADDELRYEVGRKSVTGNTDRFTFLFRKPK